MAPKIYVYISAPYAGGNTMRNIRAALVAAAQITDLGAYAYIPHLLLFWCVYNPQPDPYWHDQTYAWLEKCDILYRLAGFSEQADVEVQMAHDMGIPVIHNSYSRLQAQIRQLQERET